MEAAVGIIYVDLDRTLVRIDLLEERLLLALHSNPLLAFRAAGWLLNGGRERLKTEMARRCTIDVASLPFNENLIQFLQEKQRTGAHLVLATAAPLTWGQAVADHLGIFDRVLATDASHGNLKGERKLAVILKDADGQPFGYAGDAPSDRPILEAAQLPIVVGTRAELAGKRASSAIVISGKSKEGQSWWKSLRPHQWSKNLLIFTPLIAAHQWSTIWPQGILAFIAFSMVASAFYLLNDFCDIDLDRQHPDKRRRAQAAGVLNPFLALAIAILLVLDAAAVSIFLPWNYTIILLCYGAINFLYSSRLKKIVVMDLITLSFFYTLRVFAGAAACGVIVSTWLFAFIFFFAGSLAHLKRYTELNQRIRIGIGAAARPTYQVAHTMLILIAGLGSGLLSALVLSLYVTAPQTPSLYQTPSLLFLVCLFLFYWIERIWFLASRDRVHGDPIVFMVTDSVSYLIGLATLAIFWLA